MGRTTALGRASLALDRRRFFALAAAGALAAARPGLAKEPPPRPLRRGGRPKRVAVLGAGLAGLAAAHELAGAGHDVTILEAQRRPGGRVLTLRAPFSDGLYAEAGAGRIPDTHTVTLHYVSLFRLRLDPFYPTRLSQVAFFGGTRVPFRELSKIDMSSVALELSPAERSLGLDGLEGKLIRPLLRELGAFEGDEWPGAALKAKYDDLTIGALLTKMGASRAAIAFLTQGFQDDGALDFLRDARSHEPRLRKIRGGNDALPRAFAARLAKRIRYGAEVKEIRQGDAGVEIVYEQAGTPERLAADHVVCAIPFTVLRHLTVEPRLPDDKRAAIENVRHGNVTRVMLQTRRRYWEDEGLNGFALVDEPMEVWSPSFDQPGRRGILTAYIYEALARETGAMTEPERIRWTSNYLGKVHPGLEHELEGGATWCWDDDPYARGAYALFGPGELATMPAVIRRREGRLHFAGEHASPYPGWMQGAIMSGLRAAKEIHEEE